MGWVRNQADRLRQAFLRSPARKADEIRRSSTPDADKAGLNTQTWMQNAGYGWLAEHLQLDSSLRDRYIDYEEMDEYPELITALDIYADDATQTDSITHKTMWAESNDKKVQSSLTELLDNQLRVEDEIWSETRELSKYGNEFGELLIGEQGVVGISAMPPPAVRRVEDQHTGELLGFVFDPRGQFSMTPEDFRRQLRALQTGSTNLSNTGPMRVFEPWEVVHWRLRMKKLRSIYGFGVLEPARYVWRRLSLMEDSMILYRLTRAPARYAFYIDVGTLPQNEALAYVDKIRQQYKKQEYIDRRTGRLNLRYNPLSNQDDFWIPTREGREGTRIDVLSGPEYQQIDDVEYFRSKLVAATKVPKTYMGMESEAVRGALSQEDVRFARTVLRVQREMRRGYKQACYVHLAAIGYDDPYRIPFDLPMTVPSAIFELAQLEVWSSRAGIARDLGEVVSQQWVLQKVYGFSESDAIRLMNQRRQEERDQQMWEAQTEAEQEKIRSKAEVEAEATRAAAEARIEAAKAAAAALQAGQEGMNGGGNGFGGPPAKTNGAKKPPWMESFEDRMGRMTELLERKAKNGRREQSFEHRMTAGDRDGEKRVEDKLEEILKGQTPLGRQLNETLGLMRELNHAFRSKR